MPPTVLVVDDDEGIRLTLRDILEDEGYRVVEAADGVAGLAAVVAHHPAVLLLDLHMPRLDGWQLYAALHDRQTVPPTAIMTAGRNAAIEARRLHAPASLAKPFDLDDVVSTVQRLAAAPT